jgi:hypothetical protein
MREEDGKMTMGEKRRKREREEEGKSGSITIGDELVHAMTAAGCGMVISWQLQTAGDDVISNASRKPKNIHLYLLPQTAG